MFFCFEYFKKNTQKENVMKKMILILSVLLFTGCEFISNDTDCCSCGCGDSNNGTTVIENNITVITNCCSDECSNNDTTTESTTEPEEVKIDPKADVKLVPYDCSCGTEYDKIKGWAIIDIDENSIDSTMINKIIVSSKNGNVLKVTEDGILEEGKKLYFDYIKDSKTSKNETFNQIIHYDNSNPKLTIELLLTNGDTYKVYPK